MVRDSAREYRVGILQVGGGFGEGGACQDRDAVVLRVLERIANARTGSVKYGTATRTYFSAENAVGIKMLLVIEATIGPSASDLARASIHSGSTAKAANFLSRSASYSHCSM